MAGRDINIVGGGLAGLALGLFLREQNIPTTVFEAGQHPRHKPCGEFISGRGADLLQNILPDLPRFSRECRTVKFCLHNRAFGPAVLPRPAIAISRKTLEQKLAERFLEFGGRFQRQQRWTARFDGDGIVRATGRGRGFDPQSRLVGLKAHATALALSADLEMHFARGAYLGLAQLPDGKVNLCGLFQIKHPLRDIRDNFLNFLAETFGVSLRPHLGALEILPESFCSTAGFSFKPQPAEPRECRIGDSLCLIPPFTGNGMSIALETAKLAAGPLARFSGRKLTWDEAMQNFSQQCEILLRRRLKWASLLQRLLFTAAGPWLLLATLNSCPTLFDVFYSRTRD